jgi:hypothetical protein
LTMGALCRMGLRTTDALRARLPVTPSDHISCVPCDSGSGSMASSAWGAAMAGVGGCGVCGVVRCGASCGLVLFFQPPLLLSAARAEGGGACSTLAALVVGSAAAVRALSWMTEEVGAETVAGAAVVAGASLSQAIGRGVWRRPLAALAAHAGAGAFAAAARHSTSE